jgi:small GTP-binding protein
MTGSEHILGVESLQNSDLPHQQLSALSVSPKVSTEVPAKVSNTTWITGNLGAPPILPSLKPNSEPPTLRRKMTIVGDGACGKTYALVSFTKGYSPKVYVSTVFENYVVSVGIYNYNVDLALWDTACQEDYCKMRPLSYPDSNLTVTAFAIDSPDSIWNAQNGVRNILYCCKGCLMIVKLVDCRSRTFQ